MELLPNIKYHIVNLKSSTVLDLSGSNQTTISGWENNGGDNQLWYVDHKVGIPGAPLVVLKNVAYGKFVSISGGVRPGAPAIGSEEIREWQIRPVGSNAFSIFVPESPFLLELSKDGDRADGTPVVIAFENGSEAQKWRFERV